MEIQIHENAPGPDLPPQMIEQLLFWICRELRLSVNTMGIIFTDDNTLKDLHRTYLNDDTFTDVMTFNLSDAPPLDAEIYISTDRALENARRYKVTYISEIMRLLIHACLHLAGHEDDIKEKQTRMKSAEDRYLRDAENKFKNFL